MDSHSTQSGFTLVELLITITIATILMSIGIPSYKYVTTSNRVSGEINALLGDMQFARYEAVKEGLPVQICPTTASGTTCSATATWSGGWIVLSSTSVVLRRQLPFSSFNSNDTLTNKAGSAAVTFNREGYAVNLGAIDVFSLHDLNSISSYTRCLMLGTSGFLTTMQAGTSAQYGTCS
jgi:type IV fimbrial biogenesis protein FimT